MSPTPTAPHVFRLMCDDDQQASKPPMRTYRTDAHAPFLVIPEGQQQPAEDEAAAEPEDA